MRRHRARMQPGRFDHRRGHAALGAVHHVQRVEQREALSRDCVRSEVVAMSRPVEQVLDPMNLFNPGEVVGFP
jgi:hypothetical protein